MIFTCEAVTSHVKIYILHVISHMDHCCRSSHVQAHLVRRLLCVINSQIRITQNSNYCLAVGKKINISSALMWPTSETTVCYRRLCLYFHRWHMSCEHVMKHLFSTCCMLQYSLKCQWAHKQNILWISKKSITAFCYHCQPFFKKLLCSTQNDFPVLFSHSDSK